MNYNNVLEVNNLCKIIGKRKIVNNVSFSVKEGEIFGFLGPNGAGKTTTIRMIVGLIKATNGTVKINGHDIRKNKVRALSNIGCIVENPDMYNDLTGMQNLRFYGDLYGNISKERINEVVELIGLKDRIHDKVKKYSLGMKQRLGLGQAILSNPKLLILDEPTNGLDPMGMHDFREIIKSVAKNNNTAVFISSHILSEIELVCDRFAMIKEGVIQTVEDVSKEVEDIEKIKLITKECDRVVEVFSGKSFIRNVTKEADDVLIEIEIGDFSKLVKEIGKNDIDVDDICKVKATLEDKFMRIMNGGEANV
ncbi:ABC-2 type transport system ATP-binding protein [Clostridium cavendishii DSM 21758]|uniref:ABC-2 type transport system ATP-binding protein n=1 Tax=Clostridium cavendishii DSM 21758 TaxID=1121302 RepID=A0A1M6HYH5_9CLOT|nr:ABC transporter ATP-binding protein [Clostridium cavendishii]SHJ27290.1 ABC-2 type transport system ATP-binding protein [Clostridium cavendishii DSM 21758]